uniref:HMG box domain-containing protein n=1 Tax=Globisporangium ultimum (strain ATCC 200006 / CBS 805.95 / DAOM BR144) TaxID=431595 RepID=K3WLW4_GLOUD
MASTLGLLQAAAADTGSSTNGSTKKRPRADRDAPKPFKNAYLHFSTVRRGEVADMYPDWTVQQVSAEVGRQWKALSQHERKPWIELAQFDKARFQTELQQYIDKKRSEESQTGVPFKRKKSKNYPKQPDTAYICYWKSKRMELLSENPDMEPTLVSKEVGRHWKSLSEEERQIWKDMSAQDKLRYQQEVARYQEPSTGRSPTIVNKPIKDPYAPKPPKTGFQLFMSHNRESFTLLNMSINEFRVEMSQLWKRLTEEDKSVWYSMAKQDQLRYEAEVNAYKPPAYLSTNIVRARKRLDELKKVAKSDADAPRLPMTAYHIYLTFKRREIQLHQPRLRHNEVMRQVGLTWKELSAQDREPFLRKAEQDVDRFEKEMEAYLGTQVPRGTSIISFAEGYNSDRHAERPAKKKRKLADIEAAAPVKTRRKKNPEIPRRPQTAYNLMYMSKRAEILATYQMSHNECSALCGRMWRQMSDQEREPYHRMALEDKTRYDSEMQEYRAKLEQTRMEETEVSLKKSLGFRHFLSAKCRENEGMSYDEITAIWHNMSEPHHTLWEELASEHVGDDEGDDEEDAEEEQRRLEESARVVLGTRDLRQDHGYHHQTHFESSHHKILDHKGSNRLHHRETLGFRYFVESKKPERERWTKAMWIREWDSLTDPHRALWEELAEEHSVEVLEVDHRRTVPDLDTDAH